MSKPINLEDKLRSKKKYELFFLQPDNAPSSFLAPADLSFDSSEDHSAKGIVYHTSSPLDHQGDKNTCFDTNSIFLRPVTGFGYFKNIIMLCIEFCNGLIIKCY